MKTIFVNAAYVLDLPCILKEHYDFPHLNIIQQMLSMIVGWEATITAKRKSTRRMRILI